MKLVHTRKAHCFADRFLSPCLTLCTVLLSLSPACPAAAGEAPAQVPLETLMSMSLEELVDVKIALPTRSSMPLRKSPAIATVITAQEIRNMGARDLMDVLKIVPGTGVSRTYEGFHMVDIRGIGTPSSEKILVMIDGHSLNKNIAGSGLRYLADYLSVNDIKQVEVVRGPGSALYGANAFVAVINIITKGTADIDGVEAEASWGSFNTGKVNLMAGKVFENGFQAFSNVNYWSTNGANLEIARDRFSGTPLSAAPGDADTSFAAVEALLKCSFHDLHYEGHYMQNNRGVYIGFGNALTDNNTLKYENYWHELSYKRDIARTVNSNLKLYWDQFAQDALVKVTPPGFMGSYPEGMIGGPMVKDRTLGGELQLDYDIFRNNHLLAGFVYEKMKQYDVRSISNFNPNTFQYLGSVQDISSWANWNKIGSREIHAAYLQDEWELIKTIHLTTGVRYDHYSDFGDTTNPRVGLVWDFLRDADLKLLYGQAFSAPSFSELYNDNSPSLMGNPGLQPEEIKTYEVGAGYRLTQHLQTRLNYFYNDITELIARDTSTLPNRYVNKGGAMVDGVEVEISGNYLMDRYWKCAYVYQDPRTDTHARIENVPYQRANFTVNYPVWTYLNANVSVLWTGSRPRVAGDTRGDMPSFTTVDVALTAKNFYQGLEIQGAIHNLFDEKYSDPDLSGASMFIPNDYPREGISGMLTITCKW